jgi:hypothetical protein
MGGGKQARGLQGAGEQKRAKRTARLTSKVFEEARLKFPRVGGLGRIVEAANKVLEGVGQERQRL